MRGIIDRFEGDFAVVELENNDMINIEKSKLPKDAYEGTVLIINEDSILIDEYETEERKKKADELINDIFK
ncbi:DUF3006 domain-containing protein [Brassicibacter mesophilus]|uniref:DUF3006 domain-containing protein n=1 Tax=Brassicibacter mesophilus TaxID=745119 RepID=UPI003D21A9B3